MASKKELLDLEDFFGSFVTNLETKFSSDVEYTDILDWLDNGGVDKESFGIDLTSQQRLILATYYGVELTEEQKSILEFWKLEDRTTYDFDLGSQPRGNLVLESGRRSGKCISISSSTLLFEELGLIYPYEFIEKAMGIAKDSLSLVQEYGLVDQQALLEEHGLVPDTAISCNATVATEGLTKRAQAEAIYIKGVSKTKVVATASGYSLEATPEHRIKVMSPEGQIVWKFFADITAGDYVCIHRSTHCWVTEEVDCLAHMPPQGRTAKACNLPSTVNASWGYLLGLYTANGTWSDERSVELTLSKKDIDIYTDAFDSCGLSDYGVYEQKEPKQGARIYVCRVQLRELMNNLGCIIKQKCSERKTPWSIRQSPKDVQAAYLSGLFDGDGSVEKGGRCITLSTASKTLATETQLLLLNFGIVCTVREKIVKDRPYYVLTLRGQRSVRRFVEKIGFRLERKQKPVLESLSTTSRDGGDTERIPYQIEWLKRIRETLPSNVGRQPGSRIGRWGNKLSAEVLSQPKIRNLREEFRGIVGNSIKKSSGELFSSYRLDSLVQFAEQFGSDDKALEHFKYLQECDYFYDPVVSVEDSEAFCVDLSVPGTHEYVSQGMTNHNSLLGSLIICYEFEKLCRMPSPQKQYGLATSTLISIICVAPSAEQVSKTIYGQARAMMYNCPFLKRLIDAGKIDPLEKMIKYDEKLLYVYSGNSKSETQVGGSPILIVLDEGALFEDKDGRSNALTLWDNLGAGGLPFKEDAKRVIISSAWQEGDALEKLYKDCKESNYWIGFRLKSWQVNPLHADRSNPVIDGMYISNRAMAELLFEGIRRPGHNAFFDPDEVKRSFKIMSNLYASELPIGDDRLIRLSVKQVEPFNGYTVMHLDPAITRDAYALAYGHLENYEGRSCVFIDGIMAWVPRDGIKVSILNVQQAIYSIHSQRPLSLVSADHKESQETLQRLSSHGINVDVVNFSNSKQVQMYDIVRKLLHEERIFFPKNSPWTSLLKTELLKVQFLNGNKIDHPPDGCFVGETRIPLLDGTMPLISELVDKEVWVYSCSPEGVIKPGLARGRATKQVTDLLDIVLDSDAVIRCTPEHPFMTLSGAYIQARDIIPGVTRLMPHNRVFLGFKSIVKDTIPVKLQAPVTVYDLEVDEWDNFAVSAGVFVHNSKDISDCVAAVAWRLIGREYELFNSPIQSFRRALPGVGGKDEKIPTRPRIEEEHGFQVDRAVFRRELNTTRSRWKGNSFSEVDTSSLGASNFPDVPF